MSLQILPIDPSDRRRVRQFLGLPFRLYKDVPQWVPPLASDAQRIFDRQHPFYRHSAAAFFLALQGNDQPVGRIAVLDPHDYNAFNREHTAFFYLFECDDSPQPAQALFEAAFDWARGRSLDRIIGPKGFTTLDGIGLLVKGFEYRPAFGIPYNLPYYADRVEAAGFEAVREVVSGYLNTHLSFPDRIHRLSDMVQKRRGLHVIRCRTRRDLRAIIPKLKDLYNASLAGSSGTAPLSDEEVQALADQMMWFADPRLIKMVMKGEEPVGFLLAYPDVSAAVQRTRGRIFPVGWIDLLLELKRTKWVNVNGMGITEEYRGLGGTALLFSEMYKSVVEAGYEHADLVQIGVENDKMQRELRDLGIDFYKAHRVYARML